MHTLCVSPVNNTCSNTMTKEQQIERTTEIGCHINCWSHAECTYFALTWYLIFFNDGELLNISELN